MRLYDLMEVLARSDVVLKPSEGMESLLVAFAGACVFIGPEKNHTLGIHIDANRQDSEYRFRESKQGEGGSLGKNGTWIRLFGLPESYQVHRENDDLPTLAFEEFSWKAYQALGER